MIDYKKSNAELTTITRNPESFMNNTTIYEAVVIMAKRANQVALEIKEELSAKLEEFATHTDNLEEIFENREQIEISRFYERLPKPPAIAIQEFLEDKIYFRNPIEEENIKAADVQ
jgi:DNA-directed RNA polymerase subunit K/omega